MSFAQAISFEPQQNAPRLSEGDVMLRAYDLADFDAMWAFFQTERARFIGGPQSPRGLWYEMASEHGSWPLRGMGGWSIEAGGALAGQIVIHQPPHFPEVEIGWTLFDGFEGRGIATQAAQMALYWFWNTTEHPTLVSYVTPGNARSEALARRLGATPDRDAQRPEGESAAETTVYRHRRPLQ